MEKQTVEMLSLLDVLRNGVFLPVGLSKFSLGVQGAENVRFRTTDSAQPLEPVLANKAVSGPWTGPFSVTCGLIWKSS